MRVGAAFAAHVNSAGGNGHGTGTSDKAAPDCDANFPWAQHIVHRLAPGGTAGFGLANGSVSSGQSGEGMKIRVAVLTRSHYAIRALDWIFERPIFRSTDFVATAGIPEPTARQFRNVLIEGEILTVLRAGRGRRAYFVSLTF